jgi:hypothetical protein
MNDQSSESSSSRTVREMRARYRKGSRLPAQCARGWCGARSWERPYSVPEFSRKLVGPDVEIRISTMTIETPPESQEFPEALVNTMASQIEGLRHRAV